MELGSAISAQVAQTRQDASVSFIKDNADQDQAVADLLQSAASSIPGSPVRGVNVNIKA